MTNYTYTADDFRTARFAEHRTRPDLNAVRNADGMWVTGDRSTFLDDQHIRSNGSYRPVREAAPISLDALRTAWENADDWGLGDPIRKGDTVIVRNPDPEEFSVFTWPGYGYTPDEETRVLSRKSREPWADLAYVLKAWDAGESALDVDVEIMARWLHERGVRAVKGGDDLG